MGVGYEEGAVKGIRPTVRTEADRRPRWYADVEIKGKSRFCKDFLVFIGFLLYVLCFVFDVSTCGLDRLLQIDEICSPMSPLSEGIFI